MDTLRICRHCRASLPPTAPGWICPECQVDPGRTAPYDISQSAQLPPPTPAEIARFFPQLEILELSGQGGMGLVYKARQPQLDRIVALKILSPELSYDPAFAERFSREAQALAKLNHSNIVGVFDFGQSGDFYYFLMEFVDGVNLHKLIQNKELTPAEAQRIVIEVCQALQFAHEEGIVHRDVKPSNILIDKKGRVKIADFGLAKLLGKKSKDPLRAAQTTIVMGTPHYMAPEQVERPTEVDHRADLYSLGVVFYEMLTGELPLGRFEAPSKKALMDARLDEVVLRALEKDPSRRYQHAVQIRTAVKTLSSQAPLVADRRPSREAQRHHWSYLKQFGLMAGTALLAVFFYVMLKAYWPDTQSGRIPAGAFEGFAAGPEGSMIGRHMRSALHLTQQQLIDVNRVTHHYEREFTALERRNTEHSKDSAGHVHVIIKPFPEEVQKLKDRMWVELGIVLSAEQLAKARSLHLEKFFPHTGKNQVNVEIWREPGGDYHYIESQESGSAESSNAAPTVVKPPPARSSPLLPKRYRPYFHDSP